MCFDNAQRDDALEVINHASQKFELYMAHAARCVNQSKSIIQAEKDIHLMMSPII